MISDEDLSERLDPATTKLESVVERFIDARDEFDAVKAMAIAAREENEALKARIEAIESAANPAAAKPKAAPKPRKGAKS